MIFQISHRIHFQYDDAVIIQPLTIRLRPRSDGAQRVLDWRCELTPGPSASTSVLDVFGNVALQVSFEGSHRELTINVESEVEASRINPFDYLSLDSRVTNLPAFYDLRIGQALAPNLHRQTMDLTIGHWSYAKRSIATTRLSVAMKGPPSRPRKLLTRSEVLAVILRRCLWTLVALRAWPPASSAAMSTNPTERMALNFTPGPRFICLAVDGGAMTQPLASPSLTRIYRLLRALNPSGPPRPRAAISALAIQISITR